MPGSGWVPGTHWEQARGSGWRNRDFEVRGGQFIMSQVPWAGPASPPRLPFFRGLLKHHHTPDRCIVPSAIRIGVENLKKKNNLTVNKKLWF